MNSGQVYLHAPNYRLTSLIGQFVAPLLNNLFINGQHDSRLMTQKKIGTVYSESASTTPSHSVEKRQKQVSPACHAAARSLGAELGSQPCSPGPVESELNTYNSGNVLGLVAGAYAELSSAFRVIIDQIASQLANGHLQFFDIGHGIASPSSSSRSRGA